jgi:hypothetical protein
MILQYYKNESYEVLNIFLLITEFFNIQNAKVLDIGEYPL